MFEPIHDDYQLQIASHTEGGTTRITIIKHTSAAIDDPWERPPGTNVLVIGGRPARDELKQLLEQQPRHIFRPPLASRTAMNLKKWLDVPHSPPGRKPTTS